MINPKQIEIRVTDIDGTNMAIVGLALLDSQSMDEKAEIIYEYFRAVSNNLHREMAAAKSLLGHVPGKGTP